MQPAVGGLQLQIVFALVAGEAAQSWPSRSRTSTTAHGSCGHHAHHGHDDEERHPAREAGSSSELSSSRKVSSRPTPERSGPFVCPRPRTMWQPAHFPAPKKNARRRGDRPPVSPGWPARSATAPTRAKRAQFGFGGARTAACPRASRSGSGCESAPVRGFANPDWRPAPDPALRRYRQYRGTRHRAS